MNIDDIVGSVVRVHHKGDFRHEKVKGVVCSANTGKNEIVFRVVYFEDVAKSEDGAVNFYPYSLDEIGG